MIFLFDRFWPHRLTVRTPGFQSDNQSSILCGVTKTRKGKDWTAPVFLRFCEGTGLIFEYKNSRAGVANTYVEFDPELGRRRKIILSDL